MKIIHQLTSLLLGLGLLVLIVVGVSLARSEVTVREAISEGSLTLVKETMGSLERELLFLFIEFARYSTDPALHGVLIQSNTQYEQLADPTAHMDSLDSQWRSNPDSPWIKALLLSETSMKLKEVERTFEKEYGEDVYAEIFVTNRYGAVVGSTGLLTDFRQDDEEWWQRGRDEGAVVMPPAYDESAKAYSSDLIIRIDDGNGKFLGIIKIVIDLPAFLTPILAPPDYGAHVAHTSMAYQLYLVDGSLIHSTGVALKTTPSGLLSRATQTSGVDTVEVDGDYLVISHVKSSGLRELPSPEWTLVLFHDATELFTPIIQLRRDLLLVAVVVGLLALILGIAYSLSLSKSLKDIRDAALRLSRGEEKVKLPTGGPEEVIQIGKSLNTMRRELKKAQTGLEKKVEVRTREIADKTQSLEKFNQLAVGREIKMIELKRTIKELERKLDNRQEKKR